MNFPDIVCLTEIWCNSNEISVITLKSYQLATSFARSNMIGGGVAIFVLKNFKVCLKKSKVMTIEQEFEYAMCNLSAYNQSLSIFCLYRSPCGDLNIFLESLNELLLDVLKPNATVFCCGDFNVNFSNEDARETKALVNLFESFGLCKTITEYTRIQNNTKTTIDNIFTSLPLASVNTNIVATDLSDHFMQEISFFISCHDVKREHIFRRFFNKQCNIHMFQNDISTTDWSMLDQVHGLNNKFVLFFESFHNSLLHSFPLEKCRLDTKINNKSWLSEQIINEGKLLRDIFKCCKYTNDLNLINRYKLMKNQHEKNIAIAKRNYNNNLLLKSDNRSRTYWYLIKNETNSHTKNDFPEYFTCETHSDRIYDLKTAAETFNTYFIDSIKNLTSNRKATNLNVTYSSSNSLFLRPFLEEEVRDIILSVSVKSSSGFDDVPCKILKHVVDFLVTPITELINVSFSEGTFPDILKNTVIQPVFKKGNKNDISNYRSIALLSVFSKIFEKAFYLRLLNFLESQNFFNPQQFGFRKGVSTEHAINSLYKKVLNNLDSNNQVACILFDQKRAFDLLDIDLLLTKLQTYGVRGTASKWLRSFLSGRIQRVVLNVDGMRYSSASSEVDSGVPQGSLLGPLLFITFVNDIFSYNSINNHIMLFADDTSVISSATSTDELSFNADIAVKDISKYCLENGLILNPNKTELISFSTKDLNKSLLVRINNKTIEQSSVVKYLGVYIDSKLTWSNQIDFILKKLTTHCYVLWQLRFKVDLNLLLIYYYSYVHSCINYATITWGNCTRSNEVFILQKKIIRTILFKSKIDSCRNLFRQLGILTLPCVFILKCVTMVKLDPDIINNIRDNHDRYNFRSNMQIAIPKHRLTLVAKSPLVLPIKIFNKLPVTYTKISTIKRFVAEVKKFLIDNPFYSVEEFLNHAH